MKIALLDDHKIFGQSLKTLLEEFETIESCSYFSKSSELMKNIDKNIYHIIIVDINLKEEITGFEIIEKILKKYPDQKIIVLTSYDFINYKDKAYKLGVKDYIGKNIGVEDLIERLEKVYQGISKKITIKSSESLTEREIEILKILLQGDNKKNIAKKLYISERTLYNHIANIYEKLSVNNIVEAYNKAIELGYIDPVM